ncbi:MAG: DUF5689 domain-containing protein [Rikenellaceae bacterium]
MTLSRYRYVLVLLLLVGCTPSYMVDEDDVQGESLVDILYLKSLYQGACEVITESVVIEGYITANDLMGEFPDILYIQDSTAGVEIAVDSDFRKYGYGTHLRVVCSGLWLSNFGGKIQIGMRPVSGDSVDVIDEDSAELYLSTTEDITSPTPQSVTINTLTASHISTYVVIEDLSFIVEDGATTYCDKSAETGRSTTTYRTAKDGEGNTIKLLFMYSCDYADVALPTQPVDVCAIVDYSGGEYILRVVYYQIFW